MRALAICGSPRQGGNTEYYLRTLLTELEKHDVETEFLSLRDKTILSCRACYGCREKLKCVLNDDFAAVYERMVAADAIIIGSPVYVGRPTSYLSPLLERAGFMARTSGLRLLSGKVGTPVTVARRAGEAFAFAELLLWYYINDMIVPGSMYWNVGLAGGKGAKDADKDLEGIEIMKYSAGNIARLLKALKNAGPAQT